MSYDQLLQVVAATGALAVPFGLFAGALWRGLSRWIGRRLPPRFLKVHAVRRRSTRTGRNDGPH
ncbi:cellulose biosynthesis protein BcsF [Frateuria defendens]|uniref:cellulose biosynthesis protein BcsF n=1 Tax=Frateuria defendens TaxID=2219559 RepID=UPI00066FE723|nr:cellulose biosynthesis protein BcsF [Frateuria defendens]